MRMRKLRGPNKKMSMPFEMFRTHTQPVNLADLEARFESGASVDVAALAAAGLATRRDVPVKVLGIDNRGDNASDPVPTEEQAEPAQAEPAPAEAT